MVHQKPKGAHVYLFDLGYPPAEFPPSVIDFIAEYYAVSLEVQRSGNQSALYDPIAPIFILDGIRARFLEVMNSVSPPDFSDPRSRSVYDCCHEAVSIPPLPPTKWRFKTNETEQIERLLEQNLSKVFLPQFVGNVGVRFLRRTQ